MNRRKELVQQYMEIKTEAGIYCIRNTHNGKIFVAGTPNLKSLNGRRFELQMGTCQNQQLQREWNEYGEDAFEFEVLELLKKKIRSSSMSRMRCPSWSRPGLIDFSLTEKKDICKITNPHDILLEG